MTRTWGWLCICMTPTYYPKYIILWWWFGMGPNTSVQGFLKKIFLTNFSSIKEQNNRTCLLFYWTNRENFEFRWSRETCKIYIKKPHFVGIGLQLELTVNPKLNGLIRPGDRAGSRLMLTLGVSGHSWPPVSIPADQGHMYQRRPRPGWLCPLY